MTASVQTFCKDIMSYFGLQKNDSWNHPTTVASTNSRRHNHELEKAREFLKLAPSDPDVQVIAQTYIDIVERNAILSSRLNTLVKLAPQVPFLVCIAGGVRIVINQIRTPSDIRILDDAERLGSMIMTAATLSSLFAVIMGMVWGIEIAESKLPNHLVPQVIDLAYPETAPLTTTKK